MPYNHTLFLENIEKYYELLPRLSEKISAMYMEHQELHEPLFAQILDAFSKGNQNLLQKDPTAWMQWGLKWWQESAELTQKQLKAFLSEAADESEIEAAPRDRRFRNELWYNNRFFDSMREHYQLTARIMDEYIAQADDDLPDREAELLRFYGKQWRDAISPTNWIFTNPEIWHHALDTNGQSLVDGVKNLLNDLERGRISMTPDNAFKVGKDIATTPGKVVFENELMQLIQYAPTTKQVQEVPLLIIPAWINKFYILDLRAQNSLVKWLADQGFTVFIISWTNPDAEHQNTAFDDYLTQGAQTAVETVLKITQQPSLHLAGYCLGGTLSACLASYLEKTGQIDKLTSITFLTTLLDFDKAGDLKVFIDEPQLEAMEQVLNKTGFLEGNQMAAIFNSLRPNELIWSFVINNYLMGKKPNAFDLLYWNGDVTRMPARMHMFYLRQMYLHNRLIKPNRLTLAGQEMDISNVNLPAYFLSTQEDHIAPWHATYAGAQQWKGETRFILAGSGHIAGVINPPAKQKYFWRYAKDLQLTPEKWLESSRSNPGSWWDDWAEWLRSHQPKRVDARECGSADYPPIEDAPGRYVHVK